MEPSVLVFIIILLLAGFTVLWYFVSKEFARIAADKGYTDKRYFHYCFWLGLVGVLMVVAMPDRKAGNAIQSTSATRCGTPLRSPESAAVPGAPRRSSEPAAYVPIAFAEEQKPAASAQADTPTSAPAKPIFPLKSPGIWQDSKANIATWECTCRTLNPITTDVCECCHATWHCVCGHVNARTEKRCTSCRAWRCTCGKTNPASKGSCEGCNALKPR